MIVQKTIRFKNTKNHITPYFLRYISYNTRIIWPNPQNMTEYIHNNKWGGLWHIMIYGWELQILHDGRICLVRAWRGCQDWILQHLTKASARIAMVHHIGRQHIQLRACWTHYIWHWGNLQNSFQTVIHKRLLNASPVNSITNNLHRFVRRYPTTAHRPFWIVWHKQYRRWFYPVLMRPRYQPMSDWWRQYLQMPEYR